MNQKNTNVNKKTFKKFCFLFMGFCILTILFACADSVYYEYTFQNQTFHSIDIYVNKEYKIIKDDSEKYNNTITISGYSKRTIYVNTNQLDFVWTSHNGYDDEISYRIDGSTVFFTEKQE